MHPDLPYFIAFPSSCSLSLFLSPCVMSTIYMNQLSTLPLMEGDQDRGLLPAFQIAKDPPILFPFMISSHVDQHQGQSYGDQHLRQQYKDHLMMGGSDVVFPTPSPLFRPTIQGISSDMIQTYDPYDIENKHANGSTSRWAVAPPAKMKIMQKATSEHPERGAARKPRRRAQAHQDESQQQQATCIVRVCSDCNTTKTPLWRGGPCGPKSLCNACGIRQRKARRAMAAAAAAASNGGAAVTVSVSQQTKQATNKRAEVDRSLPFKKRRKTVVAVDQAATSPKAAAPAVTAPTKDQDHVATGDSTATAPSLQISEGSTPPAMFHAFPADEITDAALLLMTLSCGYGLSSADI